MANRHALLIGVPVYDDAEFNESRLADAVRTDIAAMRAALDQSGYVITDCPTPGAEGGGATPNRIKKAIHEACANVPVGGVLLIYFSGHGVTIDGRDYLVPSDSYRLTDSRAIAGRPLAPLAADSLVPVIPDSDALAACRAALVVFFVDACRNEPAGELPDADELGQDHVVEPGGQQPFLAGGGQFVLMMGCGAGEICQYDDTGSAFTQALAKVLDPRNSARTLAEVTEAVTKDMERRSRQTQGAAQVPVVRNPKMLTLAGDSELCEGDELADAWRKAVNASPLLKVCLAPDQVHEVVAECARRFRDATDKLYRRTAELRGGVGLIDPWTDQDYPGRVLRNTERLLDNAGLLAQQASPPQPAARLRMRPGEAALLIAAPFLREAVLAVGIRDAAGIAPVNLDRTYASGNRGDLELTHEMHQHLVRRAVGLREGDAGGPKADRREADGATASDALAMWLVHQWLAGRGTLWDEPGAREVYRLAGPLIDGCWGDAGKVEVPQLIQALIQAIGAQPGDERLLDKLTGTHVDDGWRTVAAVLWLAGIMAADPRRLPAVVPDLVGTGMELPLTDVRDAAGQRDAWVLGEERGVDLHLVCEHPALHDSFEQIVARADAAAKIIRSRLGLSSASVDRLPRGFTAKGLRPARKQDDRQAYDVPLSRFQIAEEKVRELLMGRQLYGEPELAIRELYQNALDACRWRQTRQEYLTQTGQDPAEWAGRIQFRQGTDGDGRPYLECEDNGVGMDLNTLKHIFANAGERFVYGQGFRAEQADWAALDPPLTMVSNSQFGVGVFSYFMLADEITVLTRYQHRDGVPDNQAHEVRIASSGSLFQIRPAPGRLPAGGTQVRLYLSGNAVGVSALKALRDFLWISEHRVEVAAPDGGEAWEPGELRYESGPVPPLKCGRDLWWVSGAGGLAADGIKSDVKFQGLVVNLRDEHRPQFTVDRKALRSWDRDWVAVQIRAWLPDLMDWSGFTLSWLWDIAKSDIDLAQQIFKQATSVDQHAKVTADGHAVPLRSVGCVPSDELRGRTRFFTYGSPRFRAWRSGVWRDHEDSPQDLIEGAVFGSNFSRLLPKQVAGFPVPDPLEGVLLTDWAKENGTQLTVQKLLSGIVEVGCTSRAAVRRWRKYAIVGLDLSAAREIPPIDAELSADASGLLNAMVPWPPTSETPRPKIVETLVKASILLESPLTDVMHLASSVIDWRDEAPNLTQTMEDAIAEAQRILDYLDTVFPDDQRRKFLRKGDDSLRLVLSGMQPAEVLRRTGDSPLLSGVTGPAELASASERMGLTMAQVLELSDVLAPMGVSVPARDAYPAELEAIELLTLKRVTAAGERLSWCDIFPIAVKAGISVGAAHEALARLESCGLLIRPELNVPGNLMLTEREFNLLVQGLHGDMREFLLLSMTQSVDLGYLVGTGMAIDDLWLRVTQIITHPRGQDHELLQVARNLIPFVAPKRLITHAELAQAAWHLDRTLAEAAAALRNVYPGIELPSVPADCTGLVVPWAAHGALVVVTPKGEIHWRIRPLDIVQSARSSMCPLGDFLAKLDPFRKLGAPVPAYDETIGDALNKITLDDYDADMLVDFLDEDDDDERANAPGAEVVTALRLVQVAGRFGWTLAEAHQRFARLVPIGVELDYPQVEFPDEIVRWEDLLVLTTFFDGQAPVISGTIDRAYLEKAAEEIFDLSPEEIPAKADWLRERLTIYAPLFSLELDSPIEVVVD